MVVYDLLPAICCQRLQARRMRDIRIEPMSNNLDNSPASHFNKNQRTSSSIKKAVPVGYIFKKCLKPSTRILVNIDRPSPPGNTLKINPSTAGHKGLSFLIMPIAAKTRLGTHATSPSPIPASAAPREAISSAPDTNPIVEAMPTRTPTHNENKDSVPNIAFR